jgi:hypothetical protein
MKRLAISGVVALILSTFCLAARADVIDDPTKWLQEPDLSYDGSFDIQSQWNPDSTLPGYGFDPGVIKADDWICNGLPITDIHWWGSYVNNDTMAITGFRINIYANDEGGDPLSIADDTPGMLLESWFAPFAETNETYIGDSMATTMHDPPNDYEHVYLYGWDLPQWYYQEEGTRYWLSIVAETPGVFGSAPMWGWDIGFEPAGVDTTNAVTGNVMADSPVAEGYAPEWAHMSYNMAFALTTIPEPGTIAMLGIGILGLLGIRRRK